MIKKIISDFAKLKDKKPGELTKEEIIISRKFYAITLGPLFAILLAVLIIGSNIGNSGYYDSGSECKSCHTYFTDETNERYIRYTNMCRNCYKNFCYLTGRTPSNYD